MPELPEVEIIKRGLKVRLLGERVAVVKVLRNQSVGYPEPKKFIASLRGLKFADATRRGKYLLLHLTDKKGKEKGLLVVHLRMSGRLLLLEKNGYEKNRGGHQRRVRRHLRGTTACGPGGLPGADISDCLGHRGRAVENGNRH